MQNREIKFRVWNKKMGTWADWDDFAIACVCPRHNYEGGQFMTPNSSSKGVLDCYYPESGDEYTVQQFTGLKDKSDKDIYEGDIVTARHFDDWNDETGFDVVQVIKWCELNGRWGGFTSKMLNNPKIAGNNLLNPITVIGNIFESPELCKI